MPASQPRASMTISWSSRGRSRPRRATVQGVHAVLAHAARARRSAATARQTQAYRRAAPPAAACKPLRLELAGPAAHQAGLGRRPARDMDARRSWRPQAALDIHRQAACALRRPIATAPISPATSRLSPHLRFGEISPRQIWHAVCARRRGRHAPRMPTWRNSCRELGWREFSYHLLFHHPDLATANFDTALRCVPVGEERARRCEPGSAAAPATPSSMPACANSGTPASCTTACA